MRFEPAKGQWSRFPLGQIGQTHHYEGRDLVGIRKIVQYALLAMVVVAIWQGFNGNLSAIIAKGVQIIEGGAHLITQLWHTVNSHNTKN